MTTPDWHAEAKRLFAEGITVPNIARRLNRPRSSVAWAVDAGNARERHRQRVRVQRKGVPVGVRHRVVRPRDPEPEAPPVIENCRKPSLPQISFQALPDEAAPIVRKFAPRTRLGPAGADRWREIHRRMVRDGKLSEPGLPEQLHH